MSFSANLILAILILISRKPVQNIGIGEKCGVYRGTAIIILRKYGICEAIKTSLTLKISSQLPLTQGVGVTLGWKHEIGNGDSYTVLYIQACYVHVLNKLVCLCLYLGEQWSFVVGFFIIDSHMQTAH